MAELEPVAGGTIGDAAKSGIGLRHVQRDKLHCSLTAAGKALRHAVLLCRRFNFVAYADNYRKVAYRKGRIPDTQPGDMRKGDDERTGG